MNGWKNGCVDKSVLNRHLTIEAMLNLVSTLFLCDPMDCSLPGSSVHRIFQARILEWVAIFFSRVLLPLTFHGYMASQGKDKFLVRCGYVTLFWPVECKWERPVLFSRCGLMARRHAFPL